ncbi:hypothetical protein AMEX_G24559 [Astyanax mexicanus]|uniref:Uncharacterized protein n=1 Tax=Astyanax mexicanus TaxID=7994 RepID=A0A8T2KVN5_ASTMX|nr:hypothetical protein AMEX_G24559 [Astyanax mexicanus]
MSLTGPPSSSTPQYLNTLLYRRRSGETSTTIHRASDIRSTVQEENCKLLILIKMDFIKKVKKAASDVVNVTSGTAKAAKVIAEGSEEITGVVTKGVEDAAGSVNRFFKKAQKTVKNL